MNKDNTGNKRLSRARKNKDDEYYTQMSDIEQEMYHYRPHFKGKHVFLNCDDPETSNFWRYFAMNFDFLELEQLTSTHYSYDNQPSYRMDMYKETPIEAFGKETFLTLEEANIDLPIGYLTPLKGDGDFRSDEAIAILKECDIVITNPPFSLFREYIGQLMEYEKKFIIIGNKNAVTYKEVFPLIKENDIWIGHRNMNSDMWFEVPKGDDYEKIVDGKYMKHIMACWYTNLDHKKRHEELILTEIYENNEENYPIYDNYNAIEVNTVAKIPLDFKGVMGVPITFLDKYNPEQFEILGSQRWGKSEELEKIYRGNKESVYEDKKTVVNGKETYDRIFIRNRVPEQPVTFYNIKK